MATIDFILNFAGILLWLGSYPRTFELLVKTSPARPGVPTARGGAQRLQRWYFAAALIALLLFRAWLYWQIGSAVDWSPSLSLSVISVSFRSDFLGHMILFSFLGFAATLLVFYFWLLLLSVVNGAGPEEIPVQRFVRVCLGPIGSWAPPLRMLLPFVTAFLFWLAINPMLVRFNILPATRSAVHSSEQAAVVALSSYLSWRYLIGGVLALHLLSSYVYLGAHSVWSFVALTGRNLLTPIRRLPLRCGRVDFAPLLGIALVFSAAQLAEAELTTLYRRLPL